MSAGMRQKRNEHIAEAERLLEAAKEITRAGTDNNPAAKTTVLQLLDFANTHATIAAACGE
jgi:hypothetical protein